MRNHEAEGGPEQLEGDQSILSGIKDRVEQHFFDRFEGAEKSKQLHFDSSPEMRLVRKIEEFKDGVETEDGEKRKIFDEDGNLDIKAYNKIAYARVNGMAPERMAAWLVITEADIRLVKELKESPKREKPREVHTNFSEVEVRGGQVVKQKTEEGIKEVVMTEEQMELQNPDYPAEPTGETVDGNVTVGFHVLTNLKSSELELLKVAVGASAEPMDSKNPKYLANFKNASLGLGKIKTTVIWGPEVPVIKEAMQIGQVFETATPSFVLVVMEEPQRPDTKSVHGYYIFEDRLEQADQVIAAQEQ